MRLSFSLFLLSLIAPAEAKPAGSTTSASKATRRVLEAAFVAAADEYAGTSDTSDTDDNSGANTGPRQGHPPRKRVRRSVYSIYLEQGDIYFRRAYRMEYASFRVLHKMLQPRLRHNSGAKAARNGFIDSTTRLSCALRYFAGGSAYDIALVHGVSHSEVFNSIWRVVDAVMECNDLAFSFPVDHDAQQQLALEFKKKSAASFPNCVGAVDGMLLYLAFLRSVARLAD